MKKNYGGEFKFLRCQGLSIYKEEDRDEGKAILQALMSDDDPEEEDDDSENDFLAEMEADPMSHVADYLFDEMQLNAIQEHYGHSGNFMRAFGLNPFTDDPCSEAVMIASEMVREGAARR